VTSSSCGIVARLPVDTNGLGGLCETSCNNNNGFFLHVFFDLDLKPKI